MPIRFVLVSMKTCPATINLPGRTCADRVKCRPRAALAQDRVATRPLHSVHGKGAESAASRHVGPHGSKVIHRTDRHQRRAPSTPKPLSIRRRQAGPTICYAPSGNTDTTFRPPELMTPRSITAPVAQLISTYFRSELAVFTTSTRATSSKIVKFLTR